MFSRVPNNEAEQRITDGRSVKARISLGERERERDCSATVYGRLMEDVVLMRTEWRKKDRRERESIDKRGLRVSALRMKPDLLASFADEGKDAWCVISFVDEKL